MWSVQYNGHNTHNKQMIDYLMGIIYGWSIIIYVLHAWYVSETRIRWRYWVAINHRKLIDPLGIIEFHAKSE